MIKDPLFDVSCLNSYRGRYSLSKFTIFDERQVNLLGRILQYGWLTFVVGTFSSFPLFHHMSCMSGSVKKKQFLLVHYIWIEPIREKFSMWTHLTHPNCSSFPSSWCDEVLTYQIAPMSLVNFFILYASIKILENTQNGLFSFLSL